MITDDPGTPGDGKWENNFAIAFEHRPGETAYDVPAIELNYGVGAHIQLSLQTEPVLLKRTALEDPWHLKLRLVRSMRTSRGWRRILTIVTGYCVLWLLTAIFGTRQVCQSLRDRMRVDSTFVEVSCREPLMAAPDHAFGCSTVAYAPFLVVSYWAYYDQGWRAGQSAVFLWLSRSWPVLPWRGGWIS